MNADEKKQMVEMVDQAAAKLAEHFDSVQIFVTRQCGGEEQTWSYEAGKGNFYARLGQVQEFVCVQDQFQRNYAIRKDGEKGESEV